MSNNRRTNATRKMPKKRRRISPLLKFLCFILSIAGIGLFGLFAYQFFMLNIVPNMILIPVLVVLVLITLLIIVFSNFKCRRNISKFLMVLILVLINVVYGFGNYYVYGMTKLFDKVTNLTEKTTHKINVLTDAESGLTKLSDLDDCVLGTVSSLDPKGTKKCLQDIKKKIDVQTVEYTSVEELVWALFNDQVDGIIMNESYEGGIHETYYDFGVQVNRVHTTVYYTDRSQSQSESLNKVKNITSDPFTILISGNDSYGEIGTNGRSDVNMLVTVNPNTHTILLTSIPRDYYVPMACSSQEDGCPQDQPDKLTHTGLYGVETTDKTIEDLLDIEINYTVQVNFSSLVNIVDSVGGIDVYVEDGLEVDVFAANGSKGVTAGMNHLDGERALAFSRERYAYQDGDLQRVKNQQIVIQALIEKIASPSMLMNFGKFVDAVGSAFATNMPADQIRTFIQYQFALMPKWNFESFALVGKDGNEFSPSIGLNAAVLLPYEEYVEEASDKIKAVLDGDSSNDIDTIPDNLDRLTVRTYDSSQDAFYEDQTNEIYDPVYDGYSYY